MRKAMLQRTTRETDISLELRLDGRGSFRVQTPIPFLTHMLELLSKHSLMDLKLQAQGDVEVDYHHTVEDVGIVLGKALKEALGAGKGIRRYGWASVPMDEALAQVSLDISGRAFLHYKASFPKRARIKNFDLDLIEDFLHALVANAGFTLHAHILYGRNAHHMAEALFKALAVALREAVRLEDRVKGAPSTKGRL